MDLDRFKEINDTLGHHFGAIVTLFVVMQMTARIDWGAEGDEGQRRYSDPRCTRTTSSAPLAGRISYFAPVSLKLEVGDEVKLSEADFVRLSEAFFAEIEKKYL